MNQFLYILATTVSAALLLLEIAMFLRAILSWIPGLDGTAFSDFLYTVTETLVAPVRALCDRFEWFRNSPLDVSFMIAYLLLFLLQGLVSGFTGMLF